MVKGLAAKCLCLLALLLVSSHGVKAELNLNITQGRLEPIPFALPTILGHDKIANEYGYNIGKIIADDLVSSGLFKLINPQTYIQDARTAMNTPNYAQWKVLNAQALIAGECMVDSDHVKIRFRLLDVFGQQQSLGLEVSVHRSDWRRLGHKIADAIYAKLTGETGYFDSKIVYVAESGPLKKRVRRLAIMDSDGQNHKFLTDGQHMVLSPRFSPANPDVIAFMAFVNHKARVYLVNKKTGQQKLVGGDFPGMTFSPRFSPDGTKLTMSYANAGKTILSHFDLASGKFSQITLPVAIDTSPSYSSDGQQIVFMSDRGGKPQLYTMNIDGSNQKRISFGSGSYTAPCWSPRGDYIAFIKKLGGEFYISVMRPDGSGERPLTKGFFIDTPSWSPNGRVVIFMIQNPSSSNGRGGETRIKTIDVTGNFEREFVTPNDASDPSWSPLLVD
ncbi:MAG: Tol-Pal system protein TolB [Alphaproteobacteria bacterium]|nr:Tol-Pal system protein TolB [Alphaproteobacteria bacterium]OJV45334.1 MAG: Tol-Pal system beta propeller repeat protein TolB [Alphaproteobacteria bacterium 43-37]